MEEKNRIGIIVLTILVSITLAGLIGFKFGREVNAPSREALAPRQPVDKTITDTDRARGGSVRESSNNNDSENYFLIPEAGIKIKVDSVLKQELVYFPEKKSQSSPETDVFSISTKSLVAAGGSSCNDGLGRIIKVYANFKKDPQYATNNKDNPWWMTRDGLEKSGAVQFDGFYVWFQAPQAVCSENTEVVNLTNSMSTSLSNYIKSIELIQ